MKIFCLFGFHNYFNWTKRKHYGGKFRVCMRCRKTQEYIAGWGDNYWENIASEDPEKIVAEQTLKALV